MSTLYTRNEDTEQEYSTAKIHLKTCRKFSLYIIQKNLFVRNSYNGEYSEILHCVFDTVQTSCSYRLQVL